MSHSNASYFEEKDWEDGVFDTRVIEFGDTNNGRQLIRHTAPPCFPCAGRTAQLTRRGRPC